jgi:hypothetical protein
MIRFRAYRRQTEAIQCGPSKMTPDLGSGQFLEQSLPLAKPRPLDPLPVVRQAAFLLQELPHPNARLFVTSCDEKASDRDIPARRGK